ncbi:MAG: sigma-70 family RNA polymerase sigma factor [Calditrichaeota bacterium]|nr:MAG: sigma-70 family RNA polymerase sigma factor [Calditrichota bacterium]
MAKNKITYQNWIVDIGYDPQLKSETIDNKYTELSLEQLIESGFNPGSELTVDSSNKNAIISAVRKAIAKLTTDEQEFIYRFYYMGERYNTLSEKSNKEIYKLSAMQKRIIKKLKINLHKFVKQQFGIDSTMKTECPICNSDFFTEINDLISTRNKRTTWTNVIKKIEKEYKIKITTPQILIGHEKYHM